jgi:hypothetical protein
MRSCRDSDILDDARRRTEVPEIVHEQQRECADDLPVEFGDVEAIVRVLGETRPHSRGLLDTQGHPVVEVRLLIESEHRSEVSSQGFSHGDQRSAFHRRRKLYAKGSNGISVRS